MLLFLIGRDIVQCRERAALCILFEVFSNYNKLSIFYYQLFNKKTNASSYSSAQQLSEQQNA